MERQINILLQIFKKSALSFIKVGSSSNNRTGGDYLTLKSDIDIWRTTWIVIFERFWERT